MPEEIGNLNGILSAAGGLSGALSAGGALAGTVTVFNGVYQPYTGEYEVNPTFDTRMLATANRYLIDDVTVNPIQVESVSNTAGGRTVYIGGDISYG